MKILIIGQLPPPYTGQSLQIEKILNILKKNSFNFKFIQLDFSEKTSEIGRFDISKVLKLVLIFCKICYNLLLYRPDYIYYPPAGPNFIPMIRDFILLFPIRLFKFKIIFRFHAGGIHKLYSSLNPILKYFYKFSYYHADYSLCMSEAGKIDPIFLKSKEIIIITNGVKDNFQHIENIKIDFNVLFVGICSEDKGILDFVEVIKAANRINSKIKGVIIGDIIDQNINRIIHDGINEGFIKYEGVKVGEEKRKVFQRANVLLFPTFYKSENFPTVVLEAFSYALPVVSTKWRGVVDQVNDSNGYIHDVHDITGMTKSILTLENNKDLYEIMSRNARLDYLNKYTLQAYEKNFYDFFRKLEKNILIV
ncbi:glycosyltransferase involved in cell wall biosynthesis [Rhabdobacter roseus]|uniref:Glycosyltransferase involved in cell wall biosynthesis n=1 Tax=Rhabdobacter roseus TaxID=1655419 RepID=A0A840TZF9_9BACT|nr:glycosyltransferase family 4 protein [Rhabdobacter roseus]MBB5286683.1 glycosyltransferase involved in cell wall biosynthesis [Rhabdobacter roseus]